MPDKLTDKEIVKALECCSSGDTNCCDECPLDKECGVSIPIMEKLMKYALALINHLQSKNKMLQERNVILNSLMIMQKSEDEKLVGNIDRLKEQFENSQKTSKYWKSKCEELVEELETAKAEAYEEFAKRLKEKGYFPRLSISEVVSIDDIDNLLKELVGEDNAKEKE